MTRPIALDGQIEDAIRMHREGKTSVEIANELSVSCGAVRTALRRAGLNFSDTSNRGRPTEFWHSAIQDMRAIDAVEYLTDVIDVYLASLSRDDHVVDSWGVRLPPAARRTLIALYEHAPTIATKQHLLEATCGDHKAEGEMATTKIVDVYICKIRRVLPPDIAIINTHWGVGYSLTINLQEGTPI